MVDPGVAAAMAAYGDVAIENVAVGLVDRGIDGDRQQIAGFQRFKACQAARRDQT
jgi:hypothetical protein